MPERFTETLRAASEPSWSHAVGHRFVKELFAGFMPDAVMARYLIQDHRFLDSFLILLGAALVTADTFEARLRLGRFIGAVSSEESGAISSRWSAARRWRGRLRRARRSAPCR
jgi:thiaminase (transcriptional activator TenA)